MEFFLAITKEDGTIEKIPLGPGSHRIVPPGQYFQIVDQDGKPVELPLGQDGSDLVIQLETGQQAVLEDYYETLGEGTGQPPIGWEGTSDHWPGARYIWTMRIASM